MAHEFEANGIAAASLLSRSSRATRLGFNQIAHHWHWASSSLNAAKLESPLPGGPALAAIHNVMTKTGTILLASELPNEPDFTDANGKVLQLPKS